MPVITDDTRSLAAVERIVAITPIPDADSIEAATVRGWTVVVRKGEFEPGDTVIYFEVDTALPLRDERYAFLAPRGTKEVDGADYHILKTARLRGVYSQGLVLPVSQFSAEVGLSVPGTDVTTLLGLGKWEPPMPVGGGQQAGPFLSGYAAKTDSERAQNLGSDWDELRQYGWEATEKVDGTSLTVVMDADGALRVCGRNWEISDGDNTYWNAVRRTGLLDEHVLSPGEALQGEIIGPGIQGNPLRLADVTIVVFAYLRGRSAMPRNEWPQWAINRAAPVYDLPFPDNPAAAVTQVEGLESRLAPGRLAEGVVWHTVEGRVVPSLGRSTFKAINNRYLLKSG